MTAANLLTNHTRAFAVDSGLWADSGGGPGSAQDSNAPIEDPENRARRIDGNDRGMSIGKGTLVLTAIGMHFGIWVRSFQPSLTNLIKLKFGGGGTPDQNPRVEHHFQGSDYPPKGPWIRLWVFLARTPDLTSGTLNLASVSWVGGNFDMGNVSGTSPNCHFARMDYGVEGILVDANGTFAEAEAADAAEALEIIGDGILNGPVRIKSMTDTNFTYNAGAQPLAANDWIRLDLDNTDAADNGIDWSGGGWLLEGILLTVAGTEGTINLGTGTLLGAPAITLNASCVFPGSIVSSAPLDANGANLAGITASGATGTHAITVTDLAQVANGSFTSGGAGHAVERGDVTTSITETWSGQAAGYDVGVAGDPVTTTSTGNEVIRVTVSAGQKYTINVADGASIPSVRNDGPGEVAVVAGQLELTISGWVSGGKVIIYDDDSADPQELGTELQRNDNITANEVYTYDPAKAGDQIVIVHIANGYKLLQRRLTLQAASQPFTLEPVLETN